jgi:hypothetical protein
MVFGVSAELNSKSFKIEAFKDLSMILKRSLKRSIHLPTSFQHAQYESWKGFLALNIEFEIVPRDPAPCGMPGMENHARIEKGVEICTPFP